ncbi:MAG: PLP-dependent aminotransferase family protein [Desulfobacterales bacterium]|nr:PLP-dependent aminotransferase family protein [Desulfobacterales bacterium]
MGDTDKNRRVNFLRGVPAEEALAELRPMVAQGYEQTVNKYQTQVLQYGHFNGFKPLRDLLAAVYNVHPDRVIAGNGGMEMISLLFKSLPKGSKIAVEEMTYDRVIFDAQRYGHHLVGVELTAEGINLDQLKSTLRKESVAAFYGIPFHQNPTGINYLPGNRKAAEDICRAADVLCIWDICYEALRYDGNKNEPIPVSGHGPVLVSSFTKTISPGTKCGYMVIPENLLDLMTKIIANTRLNPNLPTQGFIAGFIESGGYDAYLKYLCKLYKPKMDALNTVLNENFPGAFPCKIDGGFFSCISLPGITPEKEEAFLAAAQEEGISITPAWDAVAPDLREAKQKNGLVVRLTFPACNAEDIKWGLERLRHIAGSFA